MHESNDNVAIRHLASVLVAQAEEDLQPSQHNTSTHT